MILLLLIISACQTEKIIQIDYVLPPEPQRQEIIIDENNFTRKTAVRIIIYYEYLLQEWEAWGLSVKKLILTENEK